MDSKKEILALLPRIVPEETKERDGSISGYTIGEDGKLFQGGKYANIQYDTRYLMWRLDLPYDEVCGKINILRCNPMFIKGTYTSVPMPAACIEEYFYFKDINDIDSFIEIGDKNLSMYAKPFPIMSQDEWDSIGKLSEKGSISARYENLRSVYPSFGYNDVGAIQKTLDKIDYIMFLRAIRYLYDFALNQMHQSEENRNTIRSIESAIDNRIKEIKEGKTFIGRLTKKSKSVFLEEPQFKPKDDIIKGYLNEFVAKEDDKHPMLCGVYHDGKNGYAVASDAYILAAISSVYDEKNKGVSIYPDGKKIKDEEGKHKYPNWLTLIPPMQELTKIDLNVNDLWKFASRLYKQNSVKCGFNIEEYVHFPFEQLSINTEEKWSYFSIGYFLKFISLANRLGDGCLYVKKWNEFSFLMYITNEKKPSYLILNPCSSAIEYKGQSVVVADHYGEHQILCEYFYEGDKQGKQENKKDDSRMRMIQLQAKAAVAKLKLLEGKK